MKDVRYISICPKCLKRYSRTDLSPRECPHCGNVHSLNVRTKEGEYGGELGSLTISPML